MRKSEVTRMENLLIIGDDLQFIFYMPVTVKFQGFSNSHHHPLSYLNGRKGSWWTIPKQSQTLETNPKFLQQKKYPGKSRVLEAKQTYWLLETIYNSYYVCFLWLNFGFLKHSSSSLTLSQWKKRALRYQVRCRIN